MNDDLVSQIAKVRRDVGLAHPWRSTLPAARARTTSCFFDAPPGTGADLAHLE